MMIQKIRESFISKVVAIGVLPGLLFSNIPIVYANGGPTDTNFQGGLENTEMVDMSTGDFNYSIPLLDVGGYPLTLSYNAGISMDQQASMVGLGWSINTGAINRVVRGLPDDFDGDPVVTEMNLRPRYTVSNTLSVNAEVIGLDIDKLKKGFGKADFGINIGTSFNNYSGSEASIGVAGSVGLTEHKNGKGRNGFLNFGASSSSRSGLSTSIGVSVALGKNGAHKASLGLNRNTLHGSSLEVGYGFSRQSTKYTIGYGGNTSGSFPLSMSSYTPTSTFEFMNRTFSFDLAAGFKAPGPLDFHGGLTRTQTTVCLLSNQTQKLAYGYLNQEKGYDRDALQDFNLKLPQVHDNVNGINTPIPTNDYFMVSNNGTMFRAVRNDAGYVKDPESRSIGDSQAGSGDIAGGFGAEVGVNLTYSWNNSTSGRWDDNPLHEDELFMFTDNLPGANDEAATRYEKYTFQKVNNGSSQSTDRYQGVEGKFALRQDIETNSLNADIKAEGHLLKLEAPMAAHYDLSANAYYQKERRNRNVVFEPRTNAELTLIGEDDFRNYGLNNFNYQNGEYTGITAVTRNNTKFPDHHIGEFTVIGAGGALEVYGIPVMNRSEQVSFNMSSINNYDPVKVAPVVVDEQGLVSYDPTEDNSIANKRGDNHFYLKNHVPSHATSYLLTQSLSPDYVDKTGNGLTPDDLGNYTKFNYSYEGEKEWRFPYEKDKATFNEGFKSDVLDDMGSYAYGSRDEWYVHSIESKNYIAEFVYASREDAYAVNGENGGVSTNDSKRLHQIKLYTRKGKEYQEDPIKTVHFVYDYSLCQGTPDNPTGGGKLTLTKLYTTNHGSPQGKLYKYRFGYGDNPNYNASHSDRWGNYQDDNVNDINGGNVDIDYTHNSVLDNSEYPYTHQDKSIADQNAAKWNLTTIDLPTGSRIEVDYEADDYEYIQDVEATRMYQIGGFLSTSSSIYPVVSDFSPILFDPHVKEQEECYVLVELDQAITATNQSDADVIFENHFLPQKIESTKRYLYYNTLLNLAPYADGIIDPDVYEYIQGYCEIVEGEWDLIESNPGIWDKVIYKVKPELLNETKASSPKIHPVSIKAFQVVKEALPLVLYPEDDLQSIYNKESQINCIGVSIDLDGAVDLDAGSNADGHKKNLKSIISVYHMMKNTGYASRAVPGKGWVRMRAGEQSKIGGGHRVKEVRIYDNWKQFVSDENSAVYGTRYEYITTNTLGNSISSGVTSYEPLTGGDEIALRNPHFYVHEQKGTPSEKFYSEFPLNEEIYASNDVRYSKIKTSNIDYSNVGLALNTTGHTIYENFTAKDYPIQIDYTDLESIALRPKPLANIAGISKTRFGLSYGITVTTNDMHGKFRSKKTFSAPTPDQPEGNLIYQMENEYYEDGDGELKSHVPTVLPDGTVEERIIGMNIDMLTHINKSESNNSSVKLSVQVDTYVPSVWPGGNTSENTIYSTLTTKVIYQTGLLKKVKVEDKGRTKNTENLLYEFASGTPVVTEVTPEQGATAQKLWQFDYPAYWAYEGMGMASDNVGITRTNITGSGPTISANDKKYFQPGDQLMVRQLDISQPTLLTALPTHWVVENESTGDYYLADRDGNVFSPNSSFAYIFRVHIPGKRNLPSVNMAGITSLSPYSSSSYSQGYIHNDVINVSGAAFSEKSKIHENKCEVVDDTINPYQHNLLGQWKVKQSFVYDGDRDYSTGDSRKDGLLTAYQPFWQHNGNGNWVAINNSTHPDYVASNVYPNWIKTNKATIYDEQGNNLEVQNAADVYSASGLGYNNQIQKVSATNARYEEIVFDGFEDYFVDGIYDFDSELFTTFNNCNRRHLEFTNTLDAIQSEDAHTGKYSLAVRGDYELPTVNAITWDGVAPLSSSHSSPYQLQAEDEINTFRFINDQPQNKYVFTAWVKEVDPENVTNYFNADVRISIGGSLVIPTAVNRSEIIDGWQRIEITFNVPPTWPNNTGVAINLVADHNQQVYFDDIRIQPYDSEMEAQVIDPIKQRVVATLDNRNFATIYQYDENGKLVRVIQETERGIQTVKENRAGSKLNN